MIDAGTLRHRVEVHRMGLGTDDGYRVRSAWEKIADRWAEVIPLSGDERMRDGGVMSEQRYRVRMRGNVDVRTADQIVWRGLTIELLSVVDVDGRGRVLECEGIQHAP